MLSMLLLVLLRTRSDERILLREDAHNALDYFMVDCGFVVLAYDVDPEFLEAG